MAKHPKTVSLEGFSGKNNVLRPERTDPKYLKEALNIDIDKSGGVQKRLGYQSVEAGDFHSLWSDGNDCFAIQDNDLVRINANLSTTILQSNIYSSLTFDRADDLIFFTGEGVSGVISGNDVLPWGIAEPNPKPTLSVTAGGMTAGLYQVALTYVRSDGLESGSSLAQSITLGDASGITLNSIPTSSDPLVTDIRIYVSTPDGEVLYLYHDIPNGTSTYIIASITTAILPLMSFNRKPAPKGQIVKFAHNRAFVADGSTLWFSDPYSYHWFDYHANYFEFNEPIRGIMPVEGGIWVAADKLYYLIGKDTEKMRQEMKEPVEMVTGTSVRIPGAYIFIENTPIGYKWLITTDKGVYILFNDGIALNMTEKNYSFPEADSGAGVFVQTEGINRYLSILKKKGDSDNTAVGDQVTATIIRNGVVLEE